MTCIYSDIKGLYINNNNMRTIQYKKNMIIVFPLYSSHLCMFLICIDIIQYFSTIANNSIIFISEAATSQSHCIVNFYIAAKTIFSKIFVI